MVVVRNSTGPLHVGLCLRRTGYPLELRGSFQSSDRVLEQIWKTCAWSQQNCMLDAYVDTPWRRAGAVVGRRARAGLEHLSPQRRRAAVPRGIYQIGGQTTADGVTYGHAPTMGHKLRAAGLHAHLDSHAVGLLLADRRSAAVPRPARRRRPRPCLLRGAHRPGRARGLRPALLAVPRLDRPVQGGRSQRLQPVALARVGAARRDAPADARHRGGPALRTLGPPAAQKARQRSSTGAD